MKRDAAVVFSSYSTEDPSFRLRMVPLVSRLRASGFEVKVYSLFTDWMYVRRNRSRLHRIVIVAALAVRLFMRACVLFSMSGKRLVIVHREAFPWFTPFFERKAFRAGELSILDFDDALYAEPSHGRDWRRFLRRRERFIDVVRAADLVTVASPVLEEWALKSNSNCRLALTLPIQRPAVNWARAIQGSEPVPLVWIGSDSTLDQLLGILPALEQLVVTRGAQVVVMGGDRALRYPWPEGFTSVRWSLQAESELLLRPGIGLMPLSDDLWATGKGGYKALQYMSVGWPVVLTPLGMNEWLYSETSAALAARDQSEWLESITTLFGDLELSAHMGACGFEWVRTSREEYDGVHQIMRWVSESDG